MLPAGTPSAHAVSCRINGYAVCLRHHCAEELIVVTCKVDKINPHYDEQHESAHVVL